MTSVRAIVHTLTLMAVLCGTIVLTPPASGAPASTNVLLFTDSVVLHASIAIDNAVEQSVTTVGFPGISLAAAPDVLAPVDLTGYDTVVIGLGNNIVDRSLMRERTTAILDLFPRSTRIIWITSGPWSSRQRAFNSMLRDLRDKWANLDLAEWDRIRVPAHNQPDGIHLSYLGIARMAALVASHITGTAAVPNRRVVGHLDTATSRPRGVHLTGWALDIDTEQPIAIEITVDGRPPSRSVRTAAANRPRLDVGDAWNHGNNHGFAITLTHVQDGRRQVCVHARDTTTNERSTLGCRSVVVAHQPQGELEFMRLRRGRVQVQGWAYDPTTDAPVLIRLRADGRRIGSPFATLPRSDIAQLATAGRSPNHGFKFTVPVPPGTRQLCVWAIDPQGGRNNRLGCQSLR